MPRSKLRLRYLQHIGLLAYRLSNNQVLRTRVGETATPHQRRDIRCPSIGWYRSYNGGDIVAELDFWIPKHRSSMLWSNAAEVSAQVFKDRSYCSSEEHLLTSLQIEIEM
jgi:hypothetical protein